MNRIITILTLFLILAVSSCKKNNTSETPTLLFKSGFEGGVYIDNVAYSDNEDYRYIKGIDGETGFSWPITLWGSSESAMHYIDDDNHQAVFSELQTVIGHDGLPTKALYMQENYANGVTQCPYEILNIQDGRKDMYVKYWLKLDSASLTQTDTWRALFEYKTVGYAKNNGFRLISYVYTDENGHPYWHFQGDKNPQKPLWEVDNTSIPVPVNEWFLMEVHWHFGNKKNGTATWKINGEVVADVQDQTTRNNKPIDFIILTQIYGDANPKHQWVDDIELWEGMP